MANRLAGKVAAVTGGGDQGIGRTIAERLAQEVADVAICFRKNKKGADEVLGRISQTMRRVLWRSPVLTSMLWHHSAIRLGHALIRGAFIGAECQWRQRMVPNCP